MTEMMVLFSLCMRRDPEGIHSPHHVDAQAYGAM